MQRAAGTRIALGSSTSDSPASASVQLSWLRQTVPVLSALVVLTASVTVVSRRVSCSGSTVAAKTSTQTLPSGARNSCQRACSATLGPISETAKTARNTPAAIDANAGTEREALA